MPSMMDGKETHNAGNTDVAISDVRRRSARIQSKKLAAEKRKATDELEAERRKAETLDAPKRWKRKAQRARRCQGAQAWSTLLNAFLYSTCEVLRGELGCVEGAGHPSPKDLNNLPWLALKEKPRSVSGTLTFRKGRSIALRGGDPIQGNELIINDLIDNDTLVRGDGDILVMLVRMKGPGQGIAQFAFSPEGKPGLVGKNGVFCLLPKGAVGNVKRMSDAQVANPLALTQQNEGTRNLKWARASPTLAELKTGVEINAPEEYADAAKAPLVQAGEALEADMRADARETTVVSSLEDDLSEVEADIKEWAALLPDDWLEAGGCLRPHGEPCLPPSKDIGVRGAGVAHAVSHSDSVAESRKRQRLESAEGVDMATSQPAFAVAPPAPYDDGPDESADLFSAFNLSRTHVLPRF